MTLRHGNGIVPSGLRAHARHLVVGLALVAVDQWTKRLVESFPGESLATAPMPVLGGAFHITYGRNTGAAFGIMSGDTVSTVLLVISVAALGFIAWYYWVYRSSVWMRTAMTMIAAGAIGNLIDRFRLGYVVDFIDVDIGSYQWPYFNVADSAISTGAAMLIIYLVRQRSQRSRTEAIDDAAQ